MGLSWKMEYTDAITTRRTQKCKSKKENAIRASVYINHIREACLYTGISEKTD